MKFRTEIDIPDFSFRLGHEQRGLLVGSCFASSIGQRLERLKMPVTINPFGVVYNPASIVRTIERLETGTSVGEDILLNDNGLWFSFTHHGSFASPDKADALARINRSIELGHKALTESNYLILTFGTAWVYERTETGEIVSNCHKLPAAAFRRRRLDVEEIVSELERLFEKPLYRNKQIILTVSPVRHLKDGLAGNQLSKATLLVAVHRLVEKYAHVHYFPAYEILNDDLRDYRFYERDLVHPSGMAVDYIWECFVRSLIGEESQNLFRRLEKIESARSHRPFNPDTPQHQSFKKSILVEIRELKNQFPSLDFSEELTYFSE